MGQWEGIDEFVSVANCGSFAGAASALGLSRTHVSRAIARLEDRLSARLLHRTTRKVQLTPTGRIFLERCSRLLNDREEAMALVGERGKPQGELHVTCSTALGEHYIAPLARHFAQTYPRVIVSLDLSNRIVDLVSEGFDLAIRTGELTDSPLIATRIATRRLHTCASPHYLSSRTAPCSVEDLEQHDCLVGTSTLWHFRHEGQNRHFRPRYRWRCNNGQAILGAALDGMGICQLPDFYVRQALEDGRLIPLMVDHAPDEEPIWAVYPDRRHLSPKVRSFVRLLKAGLPAALASKNTSF